MLSQSWKQKCNWNRSIDHIKICSICWQLFLLHLHLMLRYSLSLQCTANQIYLEKIHCIVAFNFRCNLCCLICRGKSNTRINVIDKMIISVILLFHWHVFTPAFFVVVILYTCSFHQNSALCLNFVMCITYIATKWVHVIFLCVVHIQIRRTLVRRKSQFIIHVFIYTAVL